MCSFTVTTLITNITVWKFSSWERANLLALLYVMCHFPIWCPRSGVVFDWFDSWSLPSTLLCFHKMYLWGRFLPLQYISFVPQLCDKLLTVNCGTNYRNILRPSRNLHLHLCLRSMMFHSGRWSYMDFFFFKYLVCLHSFASISTPKWKSNIVSPELHENFIKRTMKQQSVNKCSMSIIHATALYYLIKALVTTEQPMCLSMLT